MQPRAYKMKRTTKTSSASSLKKYLNKSFPKLVGIMKNEDGSKGLAYGHLVPNVLVKAIQEQQVLIEALQTKVAALKGE